MSIAFKQVLFSDNQQQVEAFSSASPMGS